MKRISLGIPLFALFVTPGLALAQSFVVGEPESAILYKRATDRGAELVPFPHGLRGGKSIREEIQKKVRYDL